MKQTIMIAVLALLSVATIPAFAGQSCCQAKAKSACESCCKGDCKACCGDKCSSCKGCQ